MAPLSPSARVTMYMLTDVRKKLIDGLGCFRENTIVLGGAFVWLIFIFGTFMVLSIRELMPKIVSLLSI